MFQSTMNSQSVQAKVPIAETACQPERLPQLGLDTN